MKTTIILAVLAGVTLAQDYNNSGKEETKSALSGYDWNAVMEKLGSAFRADAKVVSVIERRLLGCRFVI